MMFTRDIPKCKGESVQEWRKVANVRHYISLNRVSGILSDLVLKSQFCFLI